MLSRSLHISVDSCDIFCYSRNNLLLLNQNQWRNLKQRKVLKVKLVCFFMQLIFIIVQVLWFNLLFVGKYKVQVN